MWFGFPGWEEFLYPLPVLQSGHVEGQERSFRKKKSHMFVRKDHIGLKLQFTFPIPERNGVLLSTRTEKGVVRFFFVYFFFKKIISCLRNMLKKSSCPQKQPGGKREAAILPTFVTVPALAQRYSCQFCRKNVSGAAMKSAEWNSGAAKSTCSFGAEGSERRVWCCCERCSALQWQHLTGKTLPNRTSSFLSAVQKQVC